MNTTLAENVPMKIHNEDDLKMLLATTYRKQIDNYFGDEKTSLRFLSAVVSATQRNPKLLDCTPVSVINSFMTMAQLQLMPSDVGGEAYVIPYANKKQVGGRYETVQEAQFQLGYQGLVTLFYRAGVKEIIAEIVYEKDQFSYVNGKIQHEPDVFNKDRGAAKGAYTIVRLATGGEVSKVLSKEEILEIGKRFSKSFSTSFSPWEQKNDPQLWMWRKTVLKQVAKLVPKSELLIQAIAKDNEDSNLEEQKMQSLLPAVNMEECERKVRACSNLDELGRVWSALPIEAKNSLEAVKDEMKQSYLPKEESTVAKQMREGMEKSQEEADVIPEEIS